MKISTFFKNSNLLIFSCFIILSTLSTHQLSAQTNEKKIARQERLFGGDPNRIAVKLNAAVVVGIINPSIEFRVHNNITVALESFACFAPKGFLFTKIPLTIATAFVEGRYYPIQSFRGFFVGPNIGYGVWRLSKGIVPAYWHTYPNEYQVGSNFMAGLTLGYQFTLTKHWGLELSWGGGYSISLYEGHRSSDGSMYVGLNKSGEWLPAYKGAVNIIYKW